MDAHNIVDVILAYFQSHPYIMIGSAAFLAVLLYFKTKAVIRLVLIFLAFAALLYIGSNLLDMTSTGVSLKKEMTREVQD